MKPQNTLKHLMNFTSNDPSRPILSGIHITDEGHAEATDSNVFIKIFNRFPENVEMVLHPKEFREIKGNYPNVSRLIPDDSGDSVYFDPGEARKMAWFLKSLPKNSLVELTSENQAILIKSENGTGNFELEKGSASVLDTYCADVKNLKIILDYIGDCVFGSIEMRFLGSRKPIVFEATDQFVAIIMPKR